MPSLPDLLKSATHDLHARAERSGVMAELIGGRLPRHGYARLLSHLQAIYVAMESRLDEPAGEPRLRPLALPGLRRSATLARDLSRLAATGDADATPHVPAARAYVARLAQASVPQLVAHVYVRYLGDLNGGRVLARLVAQHYPPDAPTAFYDFGTPEDTVALRAALRTALADLPLSPDEQAIALDEARWAFEAHCRLFQELAAT